MGTDRWLGWKGTICGIGPSPFGDNSSDLLPGGGRGVSFFHLSEILPFSDPFLPHSPYAPPPHLSRFRRSKSNRSSPRLRGFAPPFSPSASPGSLDPVRVGVGGGGLRRMTRGWQPSPRSTQPFAGVGATPLRPLATRHHTSHTCTCRRSTP